MTDGQERAPFLEAIGAFAASAPSRFFVPGHKGGAGADPQALELIGAAAFDFDIPQGIDGVDIGVGEPPLLRAEALAAELYGARRSWLLTNGATQGNHALCISLARERPVVLQRNSHASIVDGLVLSGGRPYFAVPEYDAELAMALCVTPAALERALQSAARAEAAFIVSPTYYGATADISACAEVCHAAGAALVVDQAWGPHFGFHPGLPRSALALGADAVLTSTHKIGGSLTQSAILHAAASELIDIERIDRTVRLVRSTSPSPLLLASLDGARRQLAVDGERLLAKTIASATSARAAIAEIPGCALVPEQASFESVVAWDLLRLVVDVRATGNTGHEVAQRLARDFNVHVELATDAVIVLVLGVHEPAEQLERFPAQLAEVLARLDHRVRQNSVPPARPAPLVGESALAPRDAWLADTERLYVDDAVGRISAEAIAGYPPGIPTLLPGERVTAAIVDYLRSLALVGVRLHGASDPDFRTIAVVVEQ